MKRTTQAPVQSGLTADKRLQHIHIGTSGWEYKHWANRFYPEGMNPDNHLAYYCRQFQTVEINNTFYQLPTENKLAHWMETVMREGPPNFTFAVKGSRFTTHMKKLKDPEQNAGKFLKAIEPLKPMLGPLLFQLPPRWHSNPERLDAFLSEMPDAYRYAFELRDETWFNNEVDEVLEKHGAAFCIYEIAGRQSPLKVTSNLVYIRLHGPEKTAYTGQYDKRQLNEWADRIVLWQCRGKEIYCYFDNDQNAYAVQDAKQLIESVTQALNHKHKRAQ